jgi:hypothetical protein
MRRMILRGLRAAGFDRFCFSEHHPDRVVPNVNIIR